MSDEELDQDMRRVFAASNEALEGAAFEARFQRKLQKANGWRGVPIAMASGFLGVVSGIGSGITAPFRSGLGRKGLLALLVSVIMTGLALFTS